MNDSSRTFVRSTTSTASASASVSAPAPAPASAYRPFPPMLHQLDEDISDQDIDDDSSERQVRRRSSKACDQCRKNKCKCERNATVGEPCKNCVILGTECTFLGPSRKRGPPKGYIDVIENRLHQVEALVGALLGSSDPRAASLFSDVSKDPTAKEILERIAIAPYGFKPKKKREDSHSHSRGKQEKEEPRLMPFAKPTKDWMDEIVQVIAETHPHDSREAQAHFAESSSRKSFDSPSEKHTDLGGASRIPRKSSRDSPHHINPVPPSIPSVPPVPPLPLSLITGRTIRDTNSNPPSLADTLSKSPSPELNLSEDELTITVGQLSINEYDQFRYHGKLSGLHILGKQERKDRTNEGGVWRFPEVKDPRRRSVSEEHPHSTQGNPAYKGNPSFEVPPVPPLTPRIKAEQARLALELQIRSRLPDKETQHNLLRTYWVYVHPLMPILDKHSFMMSWQNEVSMPVSSRMRSEPSHGIFTAVSPTSSLSSTSAALSRGGEHGHNRISLLLLLSIFSVASRHSKSAPPPPPNSGSTWDSGDYFLADQYLVDARSLLNQSYSIANQSTCQALLLLSYREIGVGSMAAAWLYFGLAVRMAQDLGMHRCSKDWVWRSPDGMSAARVFTEGEMQLRRRIWHACVIMDKYISTFIGRPLCIFERDFDTHLPSEDEADENEPWREPISPTDIPQNALLQNVPCHAISCFNQMSKLSNLLAEIVQAIYAVNPPPPGAPNKRLSYYLLEERLDKFYLEIPEHLQIRVVGDGMIPDPTSSPPPHFFALHLMYWCSAILLHRPFVRGKRHGATLPEQPTKEQAMSHKAFDVSMSAAGHITSLVTLYTQYYSFLQCPNFFTYYIFCAGITYVTMVAIQPDCPQAALGLQRCIDYLAAIEPTWPAAGRQRELLNGCKFDLGGSKLTNFMQWATDVRGSKRGADEPMEVSETGASTSRRYEKGRTIAGDAPSVPESGLASTSEPHQPASYPAGSSSMPADWPSHAHVQSAQQHPYSQAQSAYQLGFDFTVDPNLFGVVFPPSPPAQAGFNRWQEGMAHRPPPPHQQHARRSGHNHTSLSESLAHDLPLPPIHGTGLPTSAARMTAYWNPQVHGQSHGHIPPSQGDKPPPGVPPPPGQPGPYPHPREDPARRRPGSSGSVAYGIGLARALALYDAQLTLTTETAGILYGKCVDSEFRK